MRAYTVIVHDAKEDDEEETGYWAEVEELPGCFAAGETLEELEVDVREAIETHLEALRELGRPIPRGLECPESKQRRWVIPIPEAKALVD
jgi:predicted RNase H-like HicB family nuclease